ncbi:hypothetical protein BJY52DRAFT_1419005 [Lactarius psammicola]|nr:hypothetical protein BJY52DRAFT_1419005 [Lactarius psammicola]
MPLYSHQFAVLFAFPRSRRRPEPLAFGHYLTATKYYIRHGVALALKICVFIPQPGHNLLPFSLSLDIRGGSDIEAVGPSEKGNRHQKGYHGVSEGRPNAGGAGGRDLAWFGNRRCGSVDLSGHFSPPAQCDWLWDAAASEVSEFIGPTATMHYMYHTVTNIATRIRCLRNALTRTDADLDGGRVTALLCVLSWDHPNPRRENSKQDSDRK